VLSRFREDTLSEATSRNQLDKLNRLMRAQTIVLGLLRWSRTGCHKAMACPAEQPSRNQNHDGASPLA